MSYFIPSLYPPTRREFHKGSIWDLRPYINWNRYSWISAAPRVCSSCSVNSSMTRSSIRDWMYWRFDMSPESPKTVWLPTAWRRCTSLNRAGEPYDVGGMIGSGGGENTPITHPGCLRHHNAVLVFDCENAGSCNNGLSARIGSANKWVGDGLDDWVCWTPSAKESLTMLGFWWIVYVP
jgi:hypothetical protein